MARPTINFPATPTTANPIGNLITANGNYYFQVPQNTPHSLVIFGNFSGGTLVLSYYDPSLDGTRAVTGATWTDAGINSFEDGFSTPFAVMLLALSGAASPNLSITFAPIKQNVHDT